MLPALLVEDDTDLAATIVEYLRLESIPCDYADNGVAGLRMATENPYSVILLDLNLPLLDGLSLCERLRREGNDTPVLMLTAREQLEDKLAGFAAGTDDYLVKPFELRELVVRIRVLGQRRSGQVRVLRCGDLEMDLAAHVVTRQGQAIRLSPIGWRLLETLLRASPDVVTRQKLMAEVWGEDYPDSDSLKVHLFHLRKNIDAPFDKPLLRTLAGHGFAISEEEPR